MGRFASARIWLRRSAFFMLIALATAFIVFSRLDAPWARDVRAAIMDAVAPVVEALSVPVRAVAGWFDSFEDTADVRRQNKELRDQVARLKLQLADARRTELENKRLRELMNVAPARAARLLTARVIADPGGTYVRSFIVSAGAADGVRRGQAVINANGFIGRVVEVGQRTARVLLITDLNSRVPVMVRESGARAILAGANAGRPRLSFLQDRIPVRVGMTVVTSGHGGVIPVGLPIGRVTLVEKHRVEVQPFVDWNSVQYVRIVVFDAPGLIVPDIPQQGAAADKPRRRP